MLPVFVNYIQGRSHVIATHLIRYQPPPANVLRRAVSHLALYIDNNIILRQTFEMQFSNICT